MQQRAHTARRKSSELFLKASLGLGCHFGNDLRSIVPPFCWSLFNIVSPTPPGGSVHAAGKQGAALHVYTWLYSIQILCKTLARKIGCAEEESKSVRGWGNWARREWVCLGLC